MSITRYQVYLGAIYQHQVYLGAIYQQIERSASAEQGSSQAQALQAMAASNPENEGFVGILSQASQLASGLSGQPADGSSAPQRLQPLLEIISREQNGYQRQYAYPGQVLSLDKRYFPQRLDALTTKPDQAALWDALRKEAENLAQDDLRAYADTLLGLLERYTAQLPAGNNQPDVSLYDHLKTTAALALCMYDHAQSEAQVDERPFLLVGGDISGIQSFIYDIISKHAAKNLKGRSFYLQMLVDSVIRRLLNELELPMGHIVYASGGGFYLLAPHTQTTLDRLSKVKQDLDQYLLDKHKSALYLALGQQPMGEADLQDEALSKVWRALLDQLNQQKRRRYAAQLVASYKDFFEADEGGGLQARDAITGEEIPKGEPTKEVKNRDGTKGSVLRSTYAQVELGKKLKQADYWIMADHAQPQSDAGQLYAMTVAGVSHYLASQGQANKLAKDLVKNGGDLLARRVNEPGFNQPYLQGLKGTFGFTFYGGNDYPVDPEDHAPKDFSELAGVSDDADEETGFTRLGVLRMDVDGLGQIFIDGMAQRSLARYSTLSRSLDYFFKGYLNTIWREDEALNQYTQILYSGGDDLFIVGKWTACVTFAERIQAAFAEYCCHNPHLSLSGGLAIVPPKFPISMAADMAAEAEKAAKQHQFSLGKNEVQDKNSFCLLGISLNWTHEYPVAKHLKDQLVAWLAADHVSRSLLGRIKTHYQAYMEQTTHHRNEAWRWHMAYDFSRYGKGIRDEAVREALGQIKIAAFTDSYQNWQRGNGQEDNHSFLTLLYLAARWAELEIRTL